ncbi:MAG: hypothetical protein JSV57_01040 [Candidatus Bathyarchaeota archaeon]|nr:MAG: hypothetical protein JSV57_01040 [Candidatus Bathyarchaeota archaeon]
MFAHDVLKTLYSPIKAFEEIVKKPDIKGPMLILIVIVLITAGLQYVSSSKISDEEPMMGRDEWTESIAWISNWTSNGELARDADVSLDNYIGNYSLASSIVNSTEAWMRLTEAGSFNCSTNADCERLSFWIKWISQDEISAPPSATLTLFSGDSNDYFQLGFEKSLSNSSDEWEIVKVDFGSDIEGWTAVGSPDWEAITGLEFRLFWSAPADLTMKIDDLYLAEFVLLTEYFITGWFNSLMISALGFLILWGLYGGVLLLVLRLFGEKAGSWKALLMVVGYLFSVRIVYLGVMLLSISILPDTRLENVAQIWYPTLPYQAMLYFSFVADIWIAALCAIAVRFFYSFTWKKAITISVFVGLLSFTLRPLIPI